MKKSTQTFKRITYHNGKPHVEKNEKGVHTNKTGKQIKTYPFADLVKLLKPVDGNG